MSKLLSTAELVKKYQLDSKKSLGQNFIFDKNFTDKIVRSTFGNADDLSDYEILEIGGGPGSLSRSILDAGAKKLIIIEKDRRCILALQELKNFYGNRMEIIEGDALEIIEDDNSQGNFNKLFGDKKFKIISFKAS